MLLTTFIFFLLFPFKATDQNISEAKSPAKTEHPETSLLSYPLENAIFALPKPLFNYEKETQKIQVETLAVKEVVTGSGKDKPDSGLTLTDGEILDYLQTVFANKTSEALAVISCESGGDKDSISPTGDFGLFNINYSAHYKNFMGYTKEEKIEWILDPINNINYAYSLYNSNGWSAWYKSEWCWKPKFNL